MYKIKNINRYKCFKTQKELGDWIKNEKLYICFEGNCIGKDIKYLEEYKKTGFEPINPNIDDENFLENYLKLLEMYIVFIKDRSKELKNQNII